MEFDEDIALIEDVVLNGDTACAEVSLSLRHADLAALKAVRFSTPDAFLLNAMKVLARAQNGHTRIIPNGAIHVLPLRFVAFGASAGLVSAPQGHDALIGAELVSANNVAAADVMQRAQGYLAGTSARQSVIGAILFSWPEALRRFAALNGDEPVRYEFRKPDSQTETLSLSTSATVPAAGLYPDSEHGQIEAVDLRPFVQCTSQDGPSIELTLAGFFDESGAALEPAIHEAARLIADNPKKDVIFDLRGNTGGDFLKALPIIDQMQRVWRGSRCAVLVNGFTFSAAIVFVALLKHHLGDACKVFGAPMGDGLRFHAEGDRLALPQSGATLRYSTGWHDWETGQTTAQTPAEIVPHLVGVGTTLPEIHVPMTAADLIAGTDPQLSRARAWISASA